MRPQTTVALVLGALLGIGITWFALVRETTKVVTEAEVPPARVRPDDTRLKQSISGAQSSRAQDEIEDEAADRPVVAQPITSVRPASSLEAEKEAELLENVALTELDARPQFSSSGRGSVRDDQLIEPGEDGAYSSYRRVESLIIRTDYSADNVRLQSITYQIGSSGMLLSYELLDGKREKLYRATMTYSERQGPTFGKLIFEKIFDVHEIQFSDDLSESGVRTEEPVYTFVFSYREDGSPNEPQGMNGLKTWKDDPLIKFGDVEHIVISHGRIPPHIINALNNSYPIAPAIKL